MLWRRCVRRALKMPKISLLFGILVLLIGAEECSAIDIQNDTGDVTFVVLSQLNPVHRTAAENFERELWRQAQELSWPKPMVYLLHRDFQETGSWTIFPILDRLFEVLHQDKKWLVICQEDTEIRLNLLVKVLKSFDAKKDWFIGRALHDEEATIIHHFAFHNNPKQFRYPAFAAGFALSVPLLQKLLLRKKAYIEKLDFSIDPQHEFALFIWNDGEGVELFDAPGFCIEERDTCATFQLSSKNLDCGDTVAVEDVFFAIKSCKKFDDRVSVILRTWGSQDLIMKFFSDSTNSSYPIVNLEISNTERGHCSKTLGILNYVVQDEILSKKPWIVISDDDTLLSVPRLLKLLSCYDPLQPIALGERYGYRTASGYGYDYITGGGGMVFSMVTVRRLIESEICACPSDDTPDDMFLGICLNRLKIPIIHSSQFHQARPMDYATELIYRQEPISFHKFWMVDPIDVYSKWLNVTVLRKESRHTEL